MTHIDKAHELGIVITNNAYKNMAQCTFDAYEDFRAILIREITSDPVYEEMYKLVEYDPTDLTIPNNIAKYELGTDTNFEGGPCDNNNYPIGGWPIENVRFYENFDKGVYGIVGDNVVALNDEFAPFNFRSHGIAIIAIEKATNTEKCIYIDPSRWYQVVYKQDVNIKFETVAGIDENFILSFTNTQQFE